MSSAALRPDDRAAEHDAGGRVGDDLDEAAGVVLDERLGVGRERDLGHADLAAVGERVGLGQADVGDLGLGEDGRRRLLVVEVAVGPGVQAHHVLGDLAALHRRHRRQRQLARQVAGGVDVRHRRLAVVVDDDVAAVLVDPGGVEAEPLGVRHRADGQQRVAALATAGRRRSAPSPPSSSTSMPDGPGALDRRTPRRRKSSSRAAATSGSFCGRTCWRLTISVTWQPNDENMWTNSTPVTPEPTTIRCSGSSGGG